MSLIKLKQKHWDLGQNYVRFSDKRWHPHFNLCKEALEILIRWESYGKENITKEEKSLIEPLLSGKENYELTIKMLWEEMTEWWANHWGWIYPLIATIDCEKQNENKIFLYALLKIKESIENNGFIDSLVKFTGLSDQEKTKWLNIYLG